MPHGVTWQTSEAGTRFPERGEGPGRHAASGALSAARPETHPELARGAEDGVLLQAVRSTASISSSMLILSPTTTPPPSIGMSMSTPYSLREISVLAEKPARVPP